MSLSNQNRNGFGVHHYPRQILTEQEFYRDRRLPLPPPTRARYVRVKAMVLGLWIVGAAVGVGYTIAHEAVVPVVAWVGGALFGSVAWAIDRLGR